MFMVGADKKIKVESPAKVNLRLKITGVRKDGYHDLSMINVALDFNDIVEIEISGDDIDVNCAHPDVPSGERNICYKSVKLFGEMCPGLFSGVKINIEKNIPVAGGMGGGSSNAAAVLWGLCKLLGKDPKDEVVFEIAKQIGADVPFFLFRSPALVEGVGDLLLDTDPLPDWSYVIVGFDFGVSASFAYSCFDLTLADERDTLDGLRRSGPLGGSELFVNDLESVVAARRPIINKVKEMLKSHGCVNAMMTGSGPTVFAVFDEWEKGVLASQKLDLALGLDTYICKSVSGSILRETF